MRQEVLLADAVGCAKTAEHHADELPEVAQAWVSIGMLYVAIAEMTPAEPRPPVNRPTEL